MLYTLVQRLLHNPHFRDAMNKIYILIAFVRYAHSELAIVFIIKLHPSFVTRSDIRGMYTYETTSEGLGGYTGNPFLSFQPWILCCKKTSTIQKSSYLHHFKEKLIFTMLENTCNLLLAPQRRLRIRM